MTFWIGASLLTALTLILLMRAFVRGPNSAGLSPADVYEAQLRELDRETDDGLVSQEDAESARTEIARRLSRASGADGPSEAPGPSRITALMIAALIVFGSLGLYLVLGRPDLPAQPFALRDVDAEAAERIAPATDQIEEDLAGIDDPADRALYIADLFMSLGAYGDARESFENALAHRPGDVIALAGVGETYVLENEGVVPDEAVTWFDQALAEDPWEPRSTAYRALYDAQNGREQAALDRLNALLEAAPEGAIWRPRIEELAAQIDASLNRSGTAAAIAGLPEEEREAAIRGMVEGLAARLEGDPNDFEGWIMLANARAVLGEREEAEAALREAARIAGDEPRLLERVQGVAAQHGLNFTSP